MLHRGRRGGDQAAAVPAGGSALSSARAAAPCRVVLTGMGAITPVGLDAGTAWGNVARGRSGIGPITLFDTRDFGVRIAGEAHGFRASDFMTEREARRADRNAQFAVAAAREALAQARLRIDASNAYDVGVIVGSGAGGIWTYTAQQAILDARG